MEISPSIRPAQHCRPHQGDVSASCNDLEQARLEERISVAREIHDAIGGSLAGIKLRLARLRLANHADLPEALVEVEGLVDSAVLTVQQLVHALRPGALDQGLMEALRAEVESFERRTGIAASFQSNRSMLDLPNPHSLALYRVCQEALTNVAKHSGAQNVMVELFRDDDSISLEVADDGRGMDSGTNVRESRYGITGMHERARALGGWLEVNRSSIGGTTVMLSVPLRRAEDVRE